MARTSKDPEKKRNLMLQLLLEIPLINKISLKLTPTDPNGAGRKKKQFPNQSRSKSFIIKPSKYSAVTTGSPTADRLDTPT
jgi:hypothetical protein